LTANIYTDKRPHRWCND